MNIYSVLGCIVLEIETSARLHLSLIDLNGLEGRIDGGIGITLEEPKLQIECIEDNSRKILFEKNNNSIVDLAEYENKIREASFKICEYLNVENKYSFKIKKIYPIHHGLGLGTQLALSVAKLISKMNNIDLSNNELAKIIQRGGTSGIGVESFNSGGFIVDGGHKREQKSEFLPSSASKVSPPPVIARYDFPEQWNIIIVIPNVLEGASGKSEVEIFKSYAPINIEDVEKISYLTLMKLMPAVLEEDLNSFSDAINKIQDLGFKKIEKNLQKPLIKDILDFMKSKEISCVGMSSFGPTCFGITDKSIEGIEEDLMNLMDNDGEVIITNVKNHGFKIIKE